MKEHSNEPEKLISKNNNILLNILILYAVVMTIFSFKYYDYYRENNNDNNFTYKLSHDNTSLKVRRSSTNELFAIYYDKNYDYNYEKIEGIHKGRIIAEWIDENEDGIPELEKWYGTDGSTACLYKDLNEDGINDSVIIILENNDTLNFVDYNKNGKLELMK